MWPFSEIERLEKALVDEFECSRSTIMRQQTLLLSMENIWEERDGKLRKEIDDLKDSNTRLADALAAAKERAGDSW